jgi:hypothetical protein
MKKSIAGIALVFTAVAAASLLCETSFGATETRSSTTMIGKVRHVTHEEIDVSNELEALRIKKSNVRRVRPARELHEGDTVKIKYSLQVQDIEIMQKRNGEAGQIPDKNIIIDDRAFYPA